MIPLGSLSELFGKDFPGPFCLEKSLPKSLGNETQTVQVTMSKKSFMKTLVMFPKFFSQRQWATIPSLVVSFT